MRKASIRGGGRARRADPRWFTGAVRMDALSGTIGARGQDLYHVRFARGARTKLHAHDGDQILVATGGRGVLETFRRYGRSRSRFRIRRTGRMALAGGDVVRIPAGALHAHGSAGASAFSHIAINIHAGRRASYGTAWYESDFAAEASGPI